MRRLGRGFGWGLARCGLRVVWMHRYIVTEVSQQALAACARVGIVAARLRGCEGVVPGVQCRTLPDARYLNPNPKP